MPSTINSPDDSQDGFQTRSNLSGDQQIQGSLFGADDLVIPPGLRQMRKAVSAIHAVPIKVEQEHTLNTRRLFDACILIVQMDMKDRSKDEIARILQERISPVFEITAKALTDIAGIPGKNLQRVYEALNKLFEMVLKWNVCNEDAQVTWGMKAHFFSSLGFGHGASAGRIRFSMDPEILKIVLEPSVWANLSLTVLPQLSTPAAYALYQSCWRYVTTHQKVTAALPVKTWIELLVGPSRYIKTGPDGREVINYADFKRRTLLDAIEKVNALSALSYTLELKEYFAGKKITKLQFRFVAKTQQPLPLPSLWESELISWLGTVGFSEKEISELSQIYSRECVIDSAKRLEAAEAVRRATGKKILHRKEYFKGILANVSRGLAEEADADDQMAAKVQAEVEERRSEDRQARLKDAFAAHQASVFQKNLDELGVEKRDALIADFERSEVGQKTKILWQSKGWGRNLPAMTVLRTWVQRKNPELLDALLPAPQDRTFEHWMAWRLEQSET